MTSNDELEMYKARVRSYLARIKGDLELTFQWKNMDIEFMIKQIFEEDV